MTNAQKMEMLQMVFTKIFLSKLKGTDITQEVIVTNTGTWPGRSFVNGSLRGFDFTANVGDRVVELRCLEQNPNKTDQFGNLKKFALLARQGHQIMWIIDRKTNKWLGRIMDGEWKATFTPATTPANQQTATVSAGAGYPAASPDPYHEYLNDGDPVSVDDLPELPNDIGVPDYILQDIADMDEPPDWGEY